MCARVLEWRAELSAHAHVDGLSTGAVWSGEGPLPALSPFCPTATQRSSSQGSEGRAETRHHRLAYRSWGLIDIQEDGINRDKCQPGHLPLAWSAGTTGGWSTQGLRAQVRAEVRLLRAGEEAGLGSFFLFLEARGKGRGTLKVNSRVKRTFVDG